jgi:hypothetical protein
VTYADSWVSNAAYVSQSGPPMSLNAGTVYPVSVTMRNTGTSTWMPGGPKPFRLGSQNPQDNANWGVGRRELPNPVPPNEDAVRTP